METSENTATPSPGPANGANSRRRSGRERRVPEKFHPEVTIAPKRKRDDGDDEENQDPENADQHDDDDDEDMSDDVDDDDDEDSPDEEEQREARRQQKKKKSASQTSRAKKHTAKKPKINGTAPPATAQSISVGLPSRPKPKKTARVVTGDGRDGDGIYGEYLRSRRVEVMLLTRHPQPTYSGPATTRTMLRAGGTKNTGRTTRRP